MAKNDEVKENREEKDKAIDLAISQIERQFGKGSIMRLVGDNVMPVEVIPTGSLALDLALGVGGIPRGRVVEIYGQESSGKTTLALHILAEAQKLGGVVAFVDVEHALDPLYARKIGVDLDSLLFSQPDSGEQALEIVETLVRSNAVDAVVVDSVASLSPRAEIEGEMGDSHMGLVARLMSQALRKLSSVISKSKSCVIFTNQVRQKIGVFYGNPETTPGGLALKFHASVRIELRSGEPIKEGQEQIGSRIRATIRKNKVAPPFQKAEFDIIYGEGISEEGSLLDVAADNSIVQRSGSWFSYGGERLGQGRDNAKQYLREHPEIAQKIEQDIRANLGVGLKIPVSEETEEGAELSEESDTGETEENVDEVEASEQ
ncbi:recombinase RecA [Candidatus Poribacteria bacterium]|nr:recombinase RecA [Candidatus Poribacteria bacterium]